eukprot:gene9545-19841_t
MENRSKISLLISALLCITVYYFHYNAAKIVDKSGGIYKINEFPAGNGRRRVEAGQTTLSADLEKAKILAQDVLSLIYNRYEMFGPYGAQFFRTTNNMRSHDWDILKYKYAKKIVNRAQGQQFLMIFGGSSVTAGHDNFFNQSYPLIAEKRMSPVFEALGVKLIVHNIGMGANNCMPYELCYESMGGSEPDFVGWE